MPVTNQIVLTCATSLAASLIGAVANVAAVRFSAPDWGGKIVREIDIYRHLAGLAETAEEKLVVEMLRQDIFTETFRELGYEWYKGVPLPRRFTSRMIMICASLSIAMNVLEWSVGIQKDPFAGSIATFAISIVVTAALRKWPKSKFNGFYKAEEAKKRIAKGIKALQETLDVQELEQAERKHGQPHAVNEERGDQIEGEEPAETVQKVDEIQA